MSEDVAAKIRDQALEEAARLADQVAAGRDDLFQELAAVGELIAEGIRSLKQIDGRYIKDTNEGSPLLTAVQKPAVMAVTSALR